MVRKLFGIVAHPFAAHDVEGRGTRESGQVYLPIKQCHHVGKVPAEETHKTLIKTVVGILILLMCSTCSNHANLLAVFTCIIM